MNYCGSCGISIPEGQKGLCSMCMGDISWGKDCYYEQWARDRMDEEKRQIELQEEQQIEQENEKR
jgi:hypothetical protein